MAIPRASDAGCGSPPKRISPRSMCGEPFCMLRTSFIENSLSPYFTAMVSEPPSEDSLCSMCNGILTSADLLNGAGNVLDKPARSGKSIRNSLCLFCMAIRPCHSVMPETYLMAGWLTAWCNPVPVNLPRANNSTLPLPPLARLKATGPPHIWACTALALIEDSVKLSTPLMRSSVGHSPSPSRLPLLTV